jgi:ADP-heptose:LPS heptosyltransferase
MAHLDLIVSVDTSVGHLAGVVGKPCCLLVPGFATDWRWLHGRSDSPWYPKHRLFRGSVDGDWTKAVAALIAHAEELAEQAAALP